MKWCLIAIAAAVFSASWLTHSYTSKSFEADRAKAVERAIVQANEQAAVDAEIMRNSTIKAAEQREKTRIIIKEVTRHVASKPVYSDCALDACGLCLVQSAADGTDSTHCPCRPDPSVPAP